MYYCLLDYGYKGLKITVYWTAVAILRNESECLLIQNRDRALELPEQPNLVYVFQAMFVVHGTLRRPLTQGEAGDICVEESRISWHNGRQWKEWQNIYPAKECPKHLFLPGSRRLAFKPKNLCMVWAPPISIKSFGRHFDLDSLLRIQELERHAADITSNQRLQDILADDYSTLQIPQICYMITFLLDLYSRQIRAHSPLFGLDTLCHATLGKHLFSCIQCLERTSIMYVYRQRNYIPHLARTRSVTRTKLHKQKSCFRSVTKQTLLIIFCPSHVDRHLRPSSLRLLTPIHSAHLRSF